MDLTTINVAPATPTYFDELIYDKTQPEIFCKALVLAKLLRSRTSVEKRIQMLDAVHKASNGEIDIDMLEMLLVAGEAPLRYQEEAI